MKKTTPKNPFDCVEMKRKAAAPLNARLQGMTLEQQIAFWHERSEAFLREFGGSNSAGSTSRADAPTAVG